MITDTTGWEYFYKLDVSMLPVTTNMLYAPLVNPEKTVMCMEFNKDHPYLHNPKLTKDTIDFFFNREADNLVRFQGNTWAPTLFSIDYVDQRIFVEFSDNTVNRILLTPGRDLDTEYPDWQEKMFAMLKSIDTLGYYKMALYPHCFYFTDTGVLKTIDFYSIVPKANHFIPLRILQPIIGNDSTDRFRRSEIPGGETMLDFEEFFKITMQEQLNLRWPVNPFPEFYDRLINNV